MKDYIEIIYHFYKLILTLTINFSWVAVVFYTIYWIFNLLLDFTGSYWLSGIIIFFTYPMILILGLWIFALIVLVTKFLSKLIEDNYF